MRCRYRIGTFFTGTVTQIDRILVAAALAIAEDKSVRANAFFFNQIVDNGIYPIPAQLLSVLAGFAITDHRDLTAGIVPDLRSSAGQQSLVVLAQRNRVA